MPMSPSFRQGVVYKPLLSIKKIKENKAYTKAVKKAITIERFSLGFWETSPVVAYCSYRGFIRSREALIKMCPHCRPMREQAIIVTSKAPNCKKLFMITTENSKDA